MRALTTRSARKQWEGTRLLFFIALLAFVFVEPNPTSRSWAEDGAAGEVQGELFQQMLWPALLFLVGISVADRWKQVLQQFDLTFWLFAGWFLLTTFIAISPAVSFRRYIFMICVVIPTLISVSSFYDLRQVLRALLFALAASTLYAFAYVVLMPNYGLHQPTGAEAHLAGLWRGQFAHKNIASLVFAVAGLIIVRLRHSLPWWYLALIPLQIVFLIFSGGKTATYLAIPMYLLASFLVRSRNSAIIVIAVLAPLVIANLITVGSVFDDDAKYWAAKLIGDVSFTGRTEIWQLLLYYTSLEPFTGSGFQSFWQIATDSPAVRYGGTWAGKAFYGHQGYLDLLATVGIPGLIFGLAFIVWRPLKDICSIRDRANPLFAAFVTMWLFPLFQAVTESNLFGRADASWVLMLIAIGGLRRLRLEEGQVNTFAPVRLIPITGSPMPAE